MQSKPRTVVLLLAGCLGEYGEYGFSCHYNYEYDNSLLVTLY